MKRLLSIALAGFLATAALLAARPAGALGLDPAFSEPALGAAKAKRVVNWSHGRSINAEDWKSPTPACLEALRADNWDVMRIDRLAHTDTLAESAARLVEHVAKLKQ